MAQAYDLVCMDIMMPEMDGYERRQGNPGSRRKQRHTSTNRVKIIMTTALDDVGSVVQSIKASCDAYLLKPIHKKELLDHIKDLHLV